MAKKAIVIGSGFAGISAATCLAKEGLDVTLLEKNEVAGGRARYFEQDGFRFDMGPSWYWMPDVFDRYFELFGKKPSDYYDLERLAPSYRVYFSKDEVMDVPASMPELEALFESYEKGAGNKLRAFLSDAAYKYNVGVNELVYKPGNSLIEFLDWRVLKGLMRMNLMSSFSAFVRKYFTHPHLIQLVEFPVLFLGAKPEKTPALYSLMNYADMSLGTWYPKGGMHKVVEGMVALAQEQGVKFLLNEEVTSIKVFGKKAFQVETKTRTIDADIVVAGADYHHVEQQLLGKEFRVYDENYWKKRVMAPSSLIFYLGINKKLDGMLHHTLFFDEDFGLHAKEIYDHPQWPTKPLFYTSCPSVTDPTVAPEGKENLFILIPIAPGLQDSEEIREKYYHLVMDRLEALTGQSVKDHVIFKRSYAVKDFMKDYHAFRGNAYGLANTLMQTAMFKPKLKSKKVENLFYTGQLTVPGPGVPPSLISGQVVTKEIMKYINH